MRYHLLLMLRAVLRGSVMCVFLAAPVVWAAEGGDPSRWNEYRAAARESAKSGDFGAAELYYRNGLKEAKGFPSGDVRTARAHLEYAEALIQTRKYSAAESTPRAGIEMRMTARKTNDLVDLMLAGTLGDALHFQSRFPESLLVYSNGLRAVERKFGKYSAPTSLFLAGMAGAHAGMSNHAQADKYFKEAIKTAEARQVDFSVDGFGELNVSHKSSDPRFLATVLHNHAVVLESLNKQEAAESALKKSLKLLDQVYRKEGAAHNNGLHNLAANQLRQKKFKEAEASASRAVAIMKKTVGFESAVGRDMLALYAEALKAQNKDLSQEPALSKLPELVKKFPPRN